MPAKAGISLSFVHKTGDPRSEAGMTILVKPGMTSFAASAATLYTKNGTAQVPFFFTSILKIRNQILDNRQNI